ncbi:hypothetical protein M9Y10_018298 [Tritrichomonas musculus]|uniref:Protein kinase domain-containing protein n=1 Tax=Tritrichomonas musculus TaxID=1915356 RepID=A0ABR2HN79_9EUKA
MNAEKQFLNEINYEPIQVFYHIISNFTIKDASRIFQNTKLFQHTDIKDIMNNISSYKKTTGVLIGDFFLPNNFCLYLLIFDDIILIVNNNQLQEFHTFFNNSSNDFPLFFLNSNCEKQIQKRETISSCEKNDYDLIFHANCSQKIKEQIVNCIIKKSQIRTQNRHFEQIPNSQKFDISFNFIDFISICNISKFTYLYFNTKDQFLYILKAFERKNDYQDREIDYFERECKFYILHKNQSPFICRYYGHSETSKYKYVVIEYIDGQTLEKLISNEDLEPQEKMCIILQIMSAIEYMHLNDFIYRDLKPENILIDSKKNSFLIDFDQSKHVDGSTMTGDIGNPNFASKEQLETTNYSFESDIFSLGIIIHYILTKTILKANSTNKKEISDINNDLKEKYPKEYENIRKYYERCFKMPKLRPSIVYLMNNFFFVISKIDKKSERTIKLLNDIFHIRKKLIKKFKNQNKQGYDQILYYIGKIYYEGQYVSRDINKSIHYLTLSSDQNNSDAQYFLGKIFFSGKYFSRDIKKSIHYLTLSSNQNNSDAQLFLGAIFFVGKYVSQDINKSIYYLTLSSNQNNSDAQYLLGGIYCDGICISQDIDKTIYYLTLSSNQNNSNAQFILGKIYFDGKYITRDINKSIDYLTLSSNQNNSDAQYLLGKIYFFGTYIVKDVNLSIKYFKLSSQQNNSDAQCILGALYFDGIYITRDINKSIDYLTLSSNQNNSDAQYILGLIYYYGEHISQDINKSIYYLTLSSRQYNSDAQYFLGIIYFFGKHISQDIKKAIHYLTISSSQNNSRAQYFLGSIYYYGKYVSRDINKSIGYLTLSSEQNNSNAQYILGEIYYDGKCVPQNIEKAIHFFKESSCFNNNYAKNNLGVIYMKKNIYGAIEYFKEAIQQKNDFYSYINLARIYYFGIGIKSNFSKSIELLEKLSEKFQPANVFLYLIYSFGEESINQKMATCYQNKISKIINRIRYYLSLTLNTHDVNKVFYQRLFKFFNEYDFVYSYYQNSYNDFMYFMTTGSYNNKTNCTERDAICSINNLIDINEGFYEGFSISID